MFKPGMALTRMVVRCSGGQSRSKALPEKPSTKRRTCKTHPSAIEAMTEQVQKLERRNRSGEGDSNHKSDPTGDKANKLEPGLYTTLCTVESLCDNCLEGGDIRTVKSMDCTSRSPRRPTAGDSGLDTAKRSLLQAPMTDLEP